MTQTQAAALLGNTLVKVSRVETGHRGITDDDLARLLTEYGVPDDGDRWTWLMALSRDVSKRDWWDNYRDVVPADFTTHLALEDAAGRLATYEPLVVPGLLQTADYARALIATNLDGAPPDLDRLVEIRMRRREILRRGERPVELDAVFDESVLRHQVGGRLVMREQLHQLIEMSAVPNLTLRIVPFERGAYTGMVSGFVLISYGRSRQPDVVCLENLTSSLYVEDPERTDRYRLAFARMGEVALAPDASRTFIADVAKDL